MYNFVEDWPYASTAAMRAVWDYQYGPGGVMVAGKQEMLVYGTSVAYCNRHFPQTPDFYYAFNFRCDARSPTVSNSSSLHLLRGGETNSQNQIGLGMNPNGTISVFRGINFSGLGGTTLANGTTVLELGTTHLVELEVVFNLTAGSVRLRVDGNDEIFLNGIDTGQSIDGISLCAGNNAQYIYSGASFVVVPPEEPEEPTAPIIINAINDRDVWMQSFAERFEVVTVQYGTQVSQGQVQGAGIVLAEAKSLALTATSQTFVTNGAATEPPWIVLTPTLKNLAGTPTYSVVSGTATLVPTDGGGTRVNFTGMSSNSVTVRAAIADGGVTYWDQVTLVKLTTGGTAITAFLTNESQSLPADTFGNVLNYAGASGSFRVFEGAFEITSECVFSVLANTSNMLAAVSNLGSYVVTGMPANVDSATLTLRATYHSVNYDRSFTVTKIKAAAGSAGDPATHLDTNGNRLPMTITIPVEVTAWADATANNAFLAIGDKVQNDVVRQYNSAEGWEETRFWSVSAWRTLNAMVDGNLLVPGSIGVDSLGANTIEAFTASFEELVTTKLEASEAAIDLLIAERIEASEAEIDLLIAQRVEAVDGKFDTLTVNGTQIDPNSINTSHVVNNAITVPLILSAAPVTGVANGSPYTSGTVAGTYAGPATVAVTMACQVSVGPNANASVDMAILLNGAVQQSQAYTAPAGQVSSHIMQVHVPASGTVNWSARFSAQGEPFTLVGFSTTLNGSMK